MHVCQVLVVVPDLSAHLSVRVIADVMISQDGLHRASSQPRLPAFEFGPVHGFDALGFLRTQ